MIAIVNYGSGNIKALTNIYKILGIPCLIAERPEDLQNASKIILPGVGAFDISMQALIDSGMKSVLDHLVLVEKKPILGICVGMQLLAESSAEGVSPGLGWIKGRVNKFDINFPQISIPHMGWNSIETTKAHPLFNGIDLAMGYYFLHSYYFANSDPQDALATSHHGINFTSAVGRENIYGTQFHPEKSHSNGIRLLKNFAEL